jgi:hypothetical protein
MEVTSRTAIDSVMDLISYCKRQRTSDNNACNDALELTAGADIQCSDGPARTIGVNKVSMRGSGWQK